MSKRKSGLHRHPNNDSKKPRNSSPRSEGQDADSTNDGVRLGSVSQRSDLRRMAEDNLQAATSAQPTQALLSSNFSPAPSTLASARQAQALLSSNLNSTPLLIHLLSMYGGSSIPVQAGANSLNPLHLLAPHLMLSHPYLYPAVVTGAPPSFPIYATDTPSLNGFVNPSNTLPCGASGPIGGQLMTLPGGAAVASIDTSQTPNQYSPARFPSATAARRRFLAIAKSTDRDNFSEYQCVLREQILLFQADEEDVACSRGRTRRVVVGQVGIICKHCASQPPRIRCRGASYFPAKLIAVYGAAQNMAVKHLLDGCYQIGESIQSKLSSLKEKRVQSAGAGKEHWADDLLAVGVVETGDGLAFASGF